MDKKIKVLLKALLFIAILAVLYTILRKIGFRSIYDNILAADKVYILLAVIAVVSANLVWNLKWYFLAREVAKVRFWHLFVVTLAGSFVNTTTPGARVGGEPVKAYYLSKKYGKEKSKFFATALADKAASALSFGILSVLSMLFVIIFMDVEVKIKIILEIILVAMFLVVGAGILLRQKIEFKSEHTSALLNRIYYFSLFKVLRKRFATYSNFEKYTIKKINNIVNVIKKMVRQKRIVARDLGLAFARWIILYLGAYFLFKSFGYDVSFFAVVIVLTLSLFAGSFFIAPGGIGFIETIMISLYISFGIDPGVAATVAVMDRAIFYFLSLIAGGICLAYLSLKYK